MFVWMCPWQGGPGEVRIQHVFSCELNDSKRELILRDQEVLHVFSDVRDFENGSAHCYRCGCTHKIDEETCGIDVLEAGPSCKDLSMLNSSRVDHVSDYQQADSEEDPHGTSGITYKYGFLKAACKKLCKPCSFPLALYKSSTCQEPSFHSANVACIIMRNKHA